MLRKIESNATSGGIEDPAQYLQQWYTRISKAEPSIDYDNSLSNYMTNYHIKQFLQKYEFTSFDEYKPKNHIFGKQEDNCSDWNKCFLEPDTGWDTNMTEYYENGGSGSLHYSFNLPSK